MLVFFLVLSNVGVVQRRVFPRKMHSATVGTTLCRALQYWVVQFLYHTEMQSKSVKFLLLQVRSSEICTSRYLKLLSMVY